MRRPEWTVAFSAFSTVSSTSMVFVRSSREWWKRRNGLEPGAAACFGARFAAIGAARLGKVGIVLSLGRRNHHRTRRYPSLTQRPRGRFALLNTQFGPRLGSAERFRQRRSASGPTRGYGAGPSWTIAQ